MITKLRTRSADLGVFDTLTPESAYWIGFLMADGYVSPCGKQLALRLQARDLAHLKLFRTFLCSDHTIFPDGGNYGFMVRSERLCSALAQYGVTPRKTFTAKVCDRLALDRDFWRGVVDGDGWLALRPQNGTAYAHLELVSASRALIDQFAHFVRHVSPRWRGEVVSQRQYWRVSLGATVATEVVDALYRNTTTVLERKGAIALAVSREGLPAKPWKRAA